MRGGHNVKPSAEKKAAGTSRPIRDAGRIENYVTPVDGLDAPPEFDERHVKEWRLLCDELAKMGILTTVDRHIVQVYVEHLVMYNEAMADVKKNGTTIYIKTAFGKKPVRNPAFNVAKDCSIFMKQAWDQLGLTPRARMGIKAPEKKKESKILAMMQGGKTKAV